MYHISFFTSINKAAYGFGGLFILQGIIFLIESIVRNKLEFSFKGNTKDNIGYFFIIFGLLIYPVISYLLENYLDKTITPGLPCPTTILTFGFLMLTDKKLSKYTLIIPSIWAIIGISAAINFRIYQDYVMIIAAIFTDIILIDRKK